VHRSDDQALCSVDREGRLVLDGGLQDFVAKRQLDGSLSLTVSFLSRHPILSFGTGRPHGQYHGTGTEQYIFKSIEVELLPLNQTRKTIIDRLWRGHDPISELPGNLFEHDLQGWNSQHAYLADTINQVRPSVIVEIGVWKGGSTIYMAKQLERLGLSAVVIAVDTWLGSSEHWIGRSYIDLSIMNSRPGLYYKFLSNVVRQVVSDYVVPLPVDSLNAAEILNAVSVIPEMIHLDGGHDYESVIADLRVWWPLLALGGVLVGDDYYTDGTWPGVRRAFDEFFGKLDLTPIEHVGGKCRIRKPS
jgi:hypothetical protein